MAAKNTAAGSLCSVAVWTGAMRIESNFINFTAEFIFVKIREKINHCIVDSDFVEDELVLRVLKELKTLNEENAQELIDELKKDYEYIDSAFLYKKVMTTKEENDD